MPHHITHYKPHCTASLNTTLPSAAPPQICGRMGAASSSPPRPPSPSPTGGPQPAPQKLQASTATYHYTRRLFTSSSLLVLSSLAFSSLLFSSPFLSPLPVSPLFSLLFSSLLSFWFRKVRLLSMSLAYLISVCCVLVCFAVASKMSPPHTHTLTHIHTQTYISNTHTDSLAHTDMY